MFRMNFNLVVLCGLILSCFCSKGLHERISVTQSPDNIAVNEGESAEITCCWTQITKEISNVKVFWLKDDTKVSVEIQIYQDSPSQNCSTLHMANITSNDTGEYVCKVTKDIPVLTEVLGNKTILSIIKDRQGISATTTTTKDEILPPEEDSVHLISDTLSMITVNSYVPTFKEKPLVSDNPKTNPKDETSLDGHSVDSSNESSDLLDFVVICIFRFLPFICLLAALFYLNRYKRAIPAKAVEKPEEDLESEYKRRNYAEDSVVEEESDITEKLKTAEKTED